MKFNTKFERNGHSKPEVFPEKSRVDLLSFVPKKRQIDALILAGQRLKGTGVFDLTPERKETIDDIECDPTRNKDFDLADASMILRGLESLKSAAEAEKKYAEKWKKGPSVPSRSQLGPLTPEGSKKAVSVDPEKDKEV